MMAREPNEKKSGGFSLAKFSRRLSPALVLFLLSPAVGELLSGSAPPAEFFNPLGFIMLAVLYGGGAILIREIVLRRHKAWPALLILGAAYGIAEEALMCKSFFDPAWMDLGPLGTYGRWVGVNWVWVFELTIYHAVFSIAIPIILVSLIFRSRSDQPWIRRRTFIALLILWIVNALFIFFFISKYRPPALHYIFAIVLTVALVAAACRLPATIFHWPAGRERPVARIWFWLTGFLGTVALFFLSWVLPQTGVHPVGTIALLVGLVFVVAGTVLAMAGKAGLSDRQKFALICGALCFFIFLAPLQEFDKSRRDNTTGMTLVSLAMAVFLVCVARRLKRRERQPPAEPGCS
jgi:hypothetical protein